ncbi:15718_t:CDS:2 [Gigaspora rosea]|nr:15718_t:CDS:2 [Gigaspora rosea]
MANESSANATNGSKPNIDLQKIQKIQKRKFNIMKLKEEWEVVERSLKWRKNLIILNIVASLIVLFLGAMLIYIEVEHLADTTFRIITSSAAGTGAILTLLNVIYERLKSNGDTIKELIKAAKVCDSDQKFVPLLIDIPDQLLTDDLDKDCQNYFKFLVRINELIKEEKKFNAIFIVLASFYIILTSVISILINIEIIPHICKYDDLILAISIIIIDPKGSDSYSDFFYFCLKTAFVAPISQAIFAKINGHKEIKKINLEKVDSERKIRFFGTKEEIKYVYSKALENNNEPSSKVSEAFENKLIINDNLGLIEKYITPAFISMNVDTKYQIMIESIEITKDQKDKLSSILCGIYETV